MRFLKAADVVILVCASVGAILLSIIHVLDLFPAVQGVIEIEYPVLAVVLLALLGVHAGISHFETEDANGRAIRELDRIANKLNGSVARVFSNSAELEHYLARRIREASTEVCDLTWKRRISASFAVGKRKRSHREYESSIAVATRSITYREIFVFNDQRRVEKMKRRVAEKRDGYSCRYYDEDSEAPRLQFVIIDEIEVVFFATGAGAIACAFESEDLVRVLKPYFEDVWANATPIKDGSVLHQIQYNKIVSGGTRVSSVS